MALRSFALAASLVLLTSASVAQPRIADTVSPAVWRAFRPLVIAGGQGDKARAVTYLRAGNQLLRKVEAQLERDAATQAFQDRATASFEDLDLKELMALLPEQDGAFRRFALQGQETADSYRLSVGRGDFEVNAASKRRSFGDASSVLRMRRVRADDSRRYLLQWRGGVAVGAVSWAALLQGAQDALRTLEENAPTPTPDDRPMPLRAADAQLARTQPGLGPEDRRALAVAWASFPEVARLLTSIGSTDDVIDVQRTHDGLTHLRVVNRLDLKKMDRLYPDLTHFLRGFGDLVDARVRVVDAAGNTLLESWFDSGRMLGGVEAYVREGKLVPTRAGKPLPDASPQFQQMEAHIDVHSHAVGIHMYIDDLRIELAYTEQAAGASWTSRVRHTPIFRVEGRAFGVIPAGVLDWFIPGDIPGLARRMFEVAGKGNEGRGIAIDGRFAQASGAASIDGELGVEILDTALIRFGMKIAADRVIPDHDETEDLRKLAVAYRAALAQDLERFARYGQLP